MNLDPAAKEFVLAQRQTQAHAQAEAEAEAKRKTVLRPHEIERRGRQMNITFPTEAWPQALRKLATRWGLRPADLIVWCVAYAIDQARREKVTAPSGEGRRQHHRAGEWLDLPWEPREEEKTQ